MIATLVLIALMVVTGSIAVFATLMWFHYWLQERRLRARPEERRDG